MKNHIVVLIALVLAGAATFAVADRAKAAATPASAKDITNGAIKSAIQKLNDSPTDKNRHEFYKMLSKDGVLLLAVQEEPFPGAFGTIVLDRAVTIKMLTTEAPGGGIALLAFTDEEALLTRSPKGKFIGMKTRRILDLVLSENHAGLIINPAGPWAGVRERISSGSWMANSSSYLLGIV